MSKIDIISGFLGAGKTTLIKKLIKESYKGEKVVLIENEFGEIGIDSGFLREGGVEITEMNAGCICCSLVGDFETALQEVISKYSPDRIIIEPSGVGKLSDVIKAVQNMTLDANTTLNSRTAVVDVSKCKMYMKNFGEFFNNQIQYATTVVFSRTQNVSEEKLEAAIDSVKKQNPKAVIVTTPWEMIDGDKLIAAIEHNHSFETELLEGMHHDGECGCKEHHHHDEECGCEEHHHHDEKCGCEEHHHHDEECGGEEHHHHHDEGCSCGHHHAEEVFTSWGVETVRKFDKELLREVLEKLAYTDTYGVVLRAKGILQDIDNKWFCFDLVAGEYEIREESADYTGRLCVIGTKLDKDKLNSIFVGNLEEQ